MHGDLTYLSQPIRMKKLTRNYWTKNDTIHILLIYRNIQEIIAGQPIDNDDLKDDFIGRGVGSRQSNFMINLRRIPNREKSMKSFLMFWSPPEQRD